MDPDLLRARALTRDEARLRCALERRRADRFDLDAILQVRRTVDDLLETLGFIGRDDGFWRRLRVEEEALSKEHLDALHHFDGNALGALLIACGYRSPPKPPVEELVRDTRDALSHALAAPTHGGLAETARAQLLRFVIRARRQLATPVPDPVPVVVTVGERAARVARDVLPVAAGAAAGAAVEAVLPGSTAGVQTGVGVASLGRKAIEAGLTSTARKVTEHGARWSVGALAGRSTRAEVELGEGLEEHEDGRVPAADEVVLAHLAAARAHLHASLVERALGGRLRGGDLRAAMLHARRAADVVRDHFGPNTVSAAATLAIEVMETASRLDRGALPEQVFESEPRSLTELVDLADTALDLAEKANGTPSDEDTPWGWVVGLEDGQADELAAQWAEWKASLRPSLRGLDLAEDVSGARQVRAFGSACDDEDEKRFRHH